MKRLTALMTVVALALGTATVFAQARPNFAGKWTLDPASAPAPGGGGRGGGRGGGLGSELTIAQDATTVTLDYVGGGRNPGPVKLTYKLDGSENRNAGFGGTEQVSKAVWDGNALVVTTTIAFGDNSFDQIRKFSLEGGNLIVETTAPGREGGPATTRLVYKKAG